MGCVASLCLVCLVLDHVDRYFNFYRCAMVSRVLDDEVPYRAALAEAEVAGLQNEATLLLVQQYLLGKGVTMDLSAGLDGAAVLEAEDGPDEVIYRPAGSGSASESGAEVDPVSSGETRGASDSRFE